MALLKLDFLEVEALEYAKIDAIKNSIIERGACLFVRELIYSILT